MGDGAGVLGNVLCCVVGLIGKEGMIGGWISVRV